MKTMQSLKEAAQMVSVRDGAELAVLAQVLSSHGEPRASTVPLGQPGGTNTPWQAEDWIDPSFGPKGPSEFKDNIPGFYLVSKCTLEQHVVPRHPLPADLSYTTAPGHHQALGDLCSTSTMLVAGCDWGICRGLYRGILKIQIWKLCFWFCCLFFSNSFIFIL